MNDTARSPDDSEESLHRLPVLPAVKVAMITADKLALPDGLYDKTAASRPGDPFENIVPLIVAQSGDSKYVIIDGCKRFLRSKAAGIREFACSVLETKADETTQGFMRIMLNRNRPRALRETVYFLCWLKKRFCEKDYASTAKELGFTSKEIHETEKLVDGNDTVLELVARGIIHLACVDYFCMLTDREQALFCETFEKLQLSCQTQREFLEWLPEIACTQNKSIQQILTSADVTEIVRNTGLNAPQKIDHLRTILFSMRYPRYSQAMERWNQAAAKANPDRNAVQFSHAPAFEKRGCEISLSIKNAAHARELLEKLKSIPPESWDVLTNPAE